MDTEEVKELEDQVESLEFCWEKSLERNTFLQEELKRCYREMEQYEKKIERLENQKMDLVEELAKKLGKICESRHFDGSRQGDSKDEVKVKRIEESKWCFRK